MAVEYDFMSEAWVAPPQGNIMRYCDFNLTIDLPCSVGVLAYDVEVRVAVAYTIDCGAVEWELEAVTIRDQHGVIRKGDPVWFLLEQAITAQEKTVCAECLDDDDNRWPEWIRESRERNSDYQVGSGVRFAR